MHVGIKKDDLQGTITWTENDEKNYVVDFPDKKTVKAINKYLHTEREYQIPESNEIDDYRIDKAKPIDGPTYFLLALNTLWANTDVWVIWSKGEDD